MSFYVAFSSETLIIYPTGSPGQVRRAKMHLTYQDDIYPTHKLEMWKNFDEPPQP